VRRSWKFHSYLERGLEAKTTCHRWNVLNGIVNQILETIFKKPTMKGGKTPHDPWRGEEKCLHWDLLQRPQCWSVLLELSRVEIFGTCHKNKKRLRGTNLWIGLLNRRTKIHKRLTTRKSQLSSTPHPTYENEKLCTYLLRSFS
jgi:hypothetical protein